MATILDLKSQQTEALTKADAALKAAEIAKRSMTTAESEQYGNAMSEYRSLAVQIKNAEERANLHTLAFGRNGSINPGMLGGGNDAPTASPFSLRPANPQTRGAAYATAFHHYVASKGIVKDETLMAGFDGLEGFTIPGSERFTRQRAANGLPVMEAAMYEGTGGSSTTAGGYTISVPTAQLVVPLALPDLGVFNASTVIETATDVKIPVQSAFGGSALKTESGSSTSTFAETDPTLGQFTLSAYMIGNTRTISWELVQDAPVFQSFATDDLLKAQQIYEGNLYINGTGTSQPQGLIGNTGSGTGSAYELLGTTADAQTLIGSLYDVVGTLKEVYQANASWIMSRATSMSIRRAQMQSNLFIPAVRVLDDGTTLVLDKPVFFDSNVASLPTSTNAGVVPVLYGDFKQGYIIGVRGGGGINLKVLDQPLATQGQLILLAYRRVDGRVRRSEAIQAITISHS